MDEFDIEYSCEGCLCNSCDLSRVECYGRMCSFCSGSPNASCDNYKEYKER